MPEYVTLRIGTYDVQIRATMAGGEEDNEDGFWTNAFLNELAVAFDETGEWYKQRGFKALASRAAHYTDEIYEYLREKGYYDE